jgi:hypothetical protein
MSRAPLLVVLAAVSVGCFVDQGPPAVDTDTAPPGPASTVATESSSTSTSTTTTADETTAGATETGVETGSADPTSAGTTNAPADMGTPEPQLPGCDEQILACYRFESLTGTTPDDSAYMNHATASGVELLPGRSGMGLSMGPTSDVRALDAPQLSPGQAISYAAWFYARTLPPEGQRALIFDKGLQYSIRVFPSGASCSHTGLMSTVETPVAVGEWIHIACVHDVDNQSSLYRDGVLVGTETGNAIGVSAEPLVIGNDSPVPMSGMAFDGIIDELRIWGRALTAEEIAAEAGL